MVTFNALKPAFKLYNDCGLMEEGGGLTQGKEGAMVARVWRRGGARPGWR
jgi:hypothetical protein